MSTAAAADVPPEALICENRAVLLVLVEDPSEFNDEGQRMLKELKSSFCGLVIEQASAAIPEGATVYICGDVSLLREGSCELASRVFVVAELSRNFDDTPIPAVTVGRVPVLIRGIGVYYRNFFNSGTNIFREIATEHGFQSLTESTKAGTAHRTGIYLTPVVQDGDDFHFRLLRCSSNFSGPTANFGRCDERIVNSLNDEVAHMFAGAAPLNHVLAQIYHNNVEYADGDDTTSGGRGDPVNRARIVRQMKARIKAHADKTKDMPSEGIIAFCTFYDHLERLQPIPGDAFNLGVKGISGLTVLHFRLKHPEEARDDLPLSFKVTLYPDSVLIIPLSTNRRYTHEICPSILDALQLPVRMGYVVRCSCCEAVHSGGVTYVKMAEGMELAALQPPTPEGMAALRQKYVEENSSSGFVRYDPEPVPFSMNQGDYQQPLMRDGAAAAASSLSCAAAEPYLEEPYEGCAC